MEDKSILEKKLEAQGLRLIHFNNGRQSRGHCPMLVFFVQGELIDFANSSPEGLYSILNTEYEKRGKWSNTTYSIALPSHVDYSIINQEWESGAYVPESNWTEAYENFKKSTKFNDLTLDAFKRFVAVRLPASYERITAAEENISKLTPELAKAQAQQQRIAAELKMQIQAAEAEAERLEQAKAQRKEAAEIRRKTAAIKQQLSGKKLSLAELQELYNSL